MFIIAYKVIKKNWLSKLRLDYEALGVFLGKV